MLLGLFVCEINYPSWKTNLRHPIFDFDIKQLKKNIVHPFIKKNIQLPIF